MDGGCGATEIYKGGVLRDWANVNAPSVTLGATVLVYASKEAEPAHKNARDLVSRLALGPELVYVFWPVLLGHLRIVTHPAILPRPLNPREVWRGDILTSGSSSTLTGGQLNIGRSEIEPGVGANCLTAQAGSVAGHPHAAF